MSQNKSKYKDEITMRAIEKYMYVHQKSSTYNINSGRPLEYFSL